MRCKYKVVKYKEESVGIEDDTDRNSVVALLLQLSRLFRAHDGC